MCHLVGVPKLLHTTVNDFLKDREVMVSYGLPSTCIVHTVHIIVMLPNDQAQLAQPQALQ